jgi:hypothetical protein
MGPSWWDQPGKLGVVQAGFIERYLYRPIDTHASLSGMQNKLASIQTRYARQRARLARLGWISQGYAQNRGPGAGGPCYQWTRKVKGKTVSVALSDEQYQALQAAIRNWKEAQAILQQMQRLSREVIFGTLPHPPRRKRLGKKVLGLI